MLQATVCLCHTPAHTGKQPLKGWWGCLSSPASTDFVSALFMGVFNSNIRRYFQEASQRGYNLSLSAQSHRRRAGNNVTEIISHELGPISRQIRTYFVGQLYNITLDRRVPASVESLWWALWSTSSFHCREIEAMFISLASSQGSPCRLRG